MNILIDTLGSDRGAEEIVKGTFEATKIKTFTPYFLGDPEILSKMVRGNCEIVDAREVIRNDEEPTLAVRRKKGSSIAVGAKLLKEDKFSGMFSCGSTGGLLTAGLFIVGRMRGIERAALPVFLPTANGHTLLLDCGANVEGKPEMLLQFGIMGSLYAEYVMGIKNPKVGLLNVGVEEGKGNPLTIESYSLFKDSDLNFIGNVEAREIMNGDCDVIVSDGFSGNIALKTVEGTFIFLSSELKNIFMKSGKNKLAGLIIKDDLKEMKQKYDYRSVGGAPLLGIRKTLFKGHGSSDFVAVKNGILSMLKFIESDFVSEIKKKLGGYDEGESN